MARWKPDARGRLFQAALELYIEKGFEETTVAEIAGRVGLTERTFFRYFADKREVLFWGGHQLGEMLVRSVLAAPDSAAPLEAVAAAFEIAAGDFQERRDYVRQRQSVITAHPELQERELIKLAKMAIAITAALHQRGVGEPAASLAAEAGMAVFKVSFQSWVSGPDEREFPQVIRESFAALQAVAAGTNTA